MFFQITYTNGYCGCDITEVVEATDLENVVDWANEKLNDYAEEYAHVATGWGEDFEDDEEREMYYENCSFFIEQISSKEVTKESYVHLLV